MDQSKKPKTSSDDSSASSSSGHNHRPEIVVEMVEKKEPISYSRKIQKADREKIRRDKLNEQFLELGNALDPKRPKSDKASILTDTIQILKTLMNQVDRLKAEYATLSQESRELIQEKSELREEKTCLKSDIKILNAQYQERGRTMVPWIPHYTYPIPVVAITQASIQQPCLSSSDSNKQDSKIKSDLMRNSNHSDHKDGVCLDLELELKIHASSSTQQDVSGKEKKGSSMTSSSSQAVQDTSPGRANDKTDTFQSKKTL